VFAPYCCGGQLLVHEITRGVVARLLSSGSPCGRVVPVQQFPLAVEEYTLIKCEMHVHQIVKEELIQNVQKWQILSRTDVTDVQK
jgi:hypothetical protein